MDFVAGIDGGGTKTRLKLADLNGKLLGTFEGGPCNLNAKDAKDVTAMLKSLIGTAIGDRGLLLKNCRGICIGTAGAGREGEKTIIRQGIREMGYEGRLIITHDAVTALYGGCGEGEGIVLISGTGSICYGIAQGGETCRVGGWGHVIGDEGSAYDIAVKIVKAVMKSYDHREEETVLTKLVLERLNMSQVEELIEYVYRKGNGKQEIASIASVIGEACEQGDDLALRIVEETAQELFEHIRVVVQRLNPDHKKTNLVVNGSVFHKNLYIKNRFQKLVAETYPFIQIRQMQDDAAGGAVRIILDELRRE